MKQSSDQPAPKKSLGQHWLTDEASLLAMCDAAKVGADDVVVEIGPGTGTLTAKLVKRAGQVIAIELDPKLAKNLLRSVPSPNLQVVESDILKFDFTSLMPDYKVVANIPYYLTAHLLWVLCATPNQPVSAALLLQKEVAERVAAKPGDMSIISLSVQLSYEVALGSKVPAKLFTPPPKVDSQILVLQRRAKPLFPDIQQPQFFQMAKAGFANRRKTLLNSLAAGLRQPKEEVSQSLKRAGLNPQIRPQELSLLQWHKLYTVLFAPTKKNR